MAVEDLRPCTKNIQHICKSKKKQEASVTLSLFSLVECSDLSWKERSIFKYLYLLLGRWHNGPLKEYTCPRQGSSMAVTVMALSFGGLLSTQEGNKDSMFLWLPWQLNKKKKGGGSAGQEQTLGTFRRPWQPQRKCQTSSSSSSQISFSDPPAEERLSDFTPLSGRFYFTACEASRTFNEEAA